MKHWHRLAAGTLLLGACASALAHGGHGDTLFSGLAHPLGADHLLAAIAVGVWSAAALPAGRRATGPLLFLLCLAAGALAGAAGVAPAQLELGVAASVALLGAMLMAPRALPVPAALAVVAAAAAVHGLAHGAEWAGGDFAVYAAGFMAGTALLHLAGLGAGRSMLRARQWLWRAAAAAFAFSGVLMMAGA